MFVEKVLKNKKVIMKNIILSNWESEKIKKLEKFKKILKNYEDLDFLKKELKNIFKDKNFSNFLSKFFSVKNKQKIIDNITSLIWFIEIRNEENAQKIFGDIEKKINTKINNLLKLLT